jgi:hypothetical protein
MCHRREQRFGTDVLSPGCQEIDSDAALLSAWCSAVGAVDVVL